VCDQIRAGDRLQPPHGTEVQRFDAPPDDVCALAVSADGATFAKCRHAGDATITEWRLDGSGPVNWLAYTTTTGHLVQQYRHAGRAARSRDRLPAVACASKDGHVPLVSHTTARPRQVDTSFDSQTNIGRHVKERPCRSLTTLREPSLRLPTTQAGIDARERIVRPALVEM
jgi:hypothetical protein